MIFQIVQPAGPNLFDYKYTRIMHYMHIHVHCLTCTLLFFRQLRCDRITIHKNLFLSYVLTGVAWVLYYVFVALDGHIILQNPVSNGYFIFQNPVSHGYIELQNPISHVYSILYTIPLLSHVYVELQNPVSHGCFILLNT